MITLIGCEKEIHIDLSSEVWLFSNESFLVNRYCVSI